MKDIRPPKADDTYPEKIKAKGCCAPVWEVDIHGNKIESNRPCTTKKKYWP